MSVIQFKNEMTIQELIEELYKLPVSEFDEPINITPNGLITMLKVIQKDIGKNE